MTDKHTNRQIVVLLFSILLTLIFDICIGYKCILYEKKYDEQIYELKREIELYKVKSSTQAVNWEDENYNYLAIGNSITIHPTNDYWWNECGMAATSLEKDYVHQLSELVKENKKTQMATVAYNFYLWETQSYDRAESLLLLDELLSEKLDLITIQLSENVNELGTFETDFEELIRYIQDGAPDAQIIVIGDFWDDSQKDVLKIKACEATGVDFINLNEIKGKEEYQCGVGTIVYDEKGESHIVEHEGVAKHPNDRAMMWIASKIFEKILNSR